MEFWIGIIFSVLTSVLASSGLWAYIQSRRDKKDARNAMLIGLAHDRIVQLGVSYLERGYITEDEYENLYEYLYKPYQALGGNGSAKLIMDKVSKLEMRKAVRT